MSDTQSQEIVHGAGDLHGSSRKSSILRTAKVVCQSGEYLCLIRELSEIGLSLKFLHEAPHEPRIILQLTNGLTYPIERVWLGKSQAGYRFGTDISPSEFLSEQTPYEPRPVRLKIPAQAQIIDGRKITMVDLIDLSREGARFQSDHNHGCDRLVGFKAHSLPARLGEIRWQRGDECGIRFHHPLTLQQLATIAIELQPMHAAIADRLGGALDGATGKSRAA